MNVTRLGVKRALTHFTRPQSFTLNCHRVSPFKQRWASTSSIIKLPALLDGGDTDLKTNGIPGLYSSTGLEYAWLDYQAHIISGVIERLSQDSSEQIYHDSPLTIGLLQGVMNKYARHAQHAALFNHASMAFNNEYFFRGINKSIAPDTKTEIPNDVRLQLEIQFGSVENFKSEFLANANAIFGGGFVWLVSHKAKRLSDTRNLKILRTYNAGSPLATAHWRGQLNSFDDQSVYEYAHKLYNKSMGIPGLGLDTPEEVESRARHMEENIAGKSLQRPTKVMQATKSIAEHGAAEDVRPILCVSVWEHSYIVDWRINGKKQYLDAWWDRIDWERVAKHNPFNPSSNPSTLFD